jgi:hypothetical protein
MSRGTKIFNVAAASTVAVLALAMVPAASWGLPGVLSNTNLRHPFTVRPASISYTGDGTGFVGGFDGTVERSENRRTGNFGHITWTSWTTQSASGTGALWGDDCEPDCADGSFSPVAVTVRVFAPHRGHFTLLLLRYEREGKRYVDERRAKYVHGVVGPGYYDYFIAHESTE